jgi:hypothetical protein
MDVIVDMYVKLNGKLKEGRSRLCVQQCRRRGWTPFGEGGGLVEVEVSESVSKDGKDRSSRDGARRLLAAGSR